jgi:hypothetical protein
VPRVARMIALALRFDGLIRQGVVIDQADSPVRTAMCGRNEFSFPIQDREYRSYREGVSFTV